jgi:E1A/CREB-binding protein
LKGDDYIFYAKPEDQKTPRDSRLRQWYIDMLVECQKRSIVGMVSNMYDQYFSNKKLDASHVPYFEGDYFPGEAENIIKMLEDGGDKKGGAGGKKKKKDSSKKNSRGSSSDLTAAEEEVKCFKEGGRDMVMQKFCDAIQGMKESFIVAFLNWKDAKPEHLVVPKEIEEYREAKKLEAPKDSEDDESGKSKKRDADGNLKQTDRFGRPIKLIDDDAEEIDCEFFNSRQCFLDLCRGNHYQFDELRRAKHNPMMVLWHLQNREAPKFVQQCFSCNREISSGVRHHCNTCSDFDLCDECFKNPSANRGTCNHKLEVIKVESGQQDGGTSGLTEEQRRERQRNIQLHITLIEHASRCNSTQCKSSNCQKMKAYLKHGQTCQTKASGGCKICKRIWTLLRIHAQQCKNSNCPIPQCIAIRKRIRQLQQKQQAMDDRRRQEMNRHYRMGMMTSS